MKKYRYMVAWGSECTSVTASSEFEALRAAAKEWGVNWKEIASDTIVKQLRQEREGRLV